MGKTKYFETKPGFNHMLGWDMSRDMIISSRETKRKARNYDNSTTLIGKKTYDSIQSTQMNIDPDWMS